MKKMSWKIILLLSIIISIIINFNSYTFSGFLISSIIIALVIFGFVTLILATIRNIKKKKIKKSVILSATTIILLLSVVIVYIFLNFTSVCATLFVSDYFRTNIITGKCEIGGGGSNPCVARDPWYYKVDCNISKKEKIKLLENYEFLESYLPIASCKETCERYNRTYSESWFCDSKLMGTDDISCNDILSCPNISCSTNQ